jgi:hypothetical protein
MATASVVFAIVAVGRFKEVADDVGNAIHGAYSIALTVLGLGQIVESVVVESCLFPPNLK